MNGDFHLVVFQKITEHFDRNPDIPADKDIAVRIFAIVQQKILLKFHYAKGALTASTCDFIKPPKPDYGQEVTYNPELTKYYKVDSQIFIYNLTI